jgi:hypothetical protein
MKNQLSNLQITSASVIRAGVIGALIGLTFIALFVFPIDNPRPEWGEYWRVRPLLLTPFVAALGAISGYLVLKAGSHYGVNRSVSFIIGLLGFIISLWLGIVLGLAGTLWN